MIVGLAGGATQTGVPAYAMGSCDVFVVKTPFSCTGLHPTGRNRLFSDALACAIGHCAGGDDWEGPDEGQTAVSPPESDAVSVDGGGSRVPHASSVVALPYIEVGNCMLVLWSLLP